MGKPRVAIVFDGQGWYVRRIAMIEHNQADDEKIYYCDEPIANDVSALKALAVAKQYIEDHDEGTHDR